MIIKVETLKYIEQGISKLLDKDIKEIISDVEEFDYINNSDSFSEYVTQNKKYKIEKIYMCHLTRRFKESTNEILLPLNQLLVTENEFSEFLASYGIAFKKDNGILNLFFQNRFIDLEVYDVLAYEGVGRLKKRFKEDYCVNGLQFLYDVKNNSWSDYGSYLEVPELIRDLDEILKTRMSKEYQDRTEKYCALCKVKIDEVIFDGKKIENTLKESEYIKKCIEFMYRYYKKSILNNVRLRIDDNRSIKVEKWVPEEDFR